MACAIRGVQDLVVKDREVQGEAETDGVGRGELGLGDVGGVLGVRSVSSCHGASNDVAYLVGVVRGGSSTLALLAGCELGEVAVVVSLPVHGSINTHHSYRSSGVNVNVHLVVEHLALTGLRLGDEALVENIEHILTHPLKLELDLLAVLADDADVLVRALGLLFLLNTRDDAPGSTTRADHVLVGDRKQVALVDSELATDLYHLRQSRCHGKRCGRCMALSRDRNIGAGIPYLRDFLFHMSVLFTLQSSFSRCTHLHVADHLCKITS